MRPALISQVGSPGGKLLNHERHHHHLSRSKSLICYPPTPKRKGRNTLHRQKCYEQHFPPDIQPKWGLDPTTEQPYVMNGKRATPLIFSLPCLPLWQTLHTLMGNFVSSQFLSIATSGLDHVPNTAPPTHLPSQPATFTPYTFWTWRWRQQVPLNHSLPPILHNITSPKTTSWNFAASQPAETALWNNKQFPSILALMAMRSNYLQRLSICRSLPFQPQEVYIHQKV